MKGDQFLGQHEDCNEIRERGRHDFVCVLYFATKNFLVEYVSYLFCICSHKKNVHYVHMKHATTIGHA
jgi:hypothetical protein